MKVAILCQEEPVFLGPFLRNVMQMHPDRMAAVFMAGRRSAGEKKKNFQQRLESLRIFWRIMEPGGFISALFVSRRAALLGRRDPRSVEGMARRLSIPVYGVEDPNSDTFHKLLREVAPDVVLNQSERMLKKDVLAIPRRGFVNRHASLLPDFRGRLASFWSHAAETPRYGITIHQVDEGVDSGPIILQKECKDIPATWAYPKVMNRLCLEAPALFWQAMERFEEEAFRPEPQAGGGKAYRFPTLKDAGDYRERMKRRRRDGEGA